MCWSSTLVLVYYSCSDGSTEYQQSARELSALVVCPKTLSVGASTSTRDEPREFGK